MRSWNSRDSEAFRRQIRKKLVGCSISIQRGSTAYISYEGYTFSVEFRNNAITTPREFRCDCYGAYKNTTSLRDYIETIGAQANDRTIDGLIAHIHATLAEQFERDVIKLGSIHVP